jgi:hypothetical protein
MTADRKWDVPPSELLVPFDGRFRIAEAQVARMVQETLESLGGDFANIDEAARLALAECREVLERQ